LLLQRSANPRDDETPDSSRAPSTEPSLTPPLTGRSSEGPLADAAVQADNTSSGATTTAQHADTAAPNRPAATGPSPAQSLTLAPALRESASIATPSAQPHQISPTSDSTTVDPQPRGLSAAAPGTTARAGLESQPRTRTVALQKPDVLESQPRLLSAALVPSPDGAIDMDGPHWILHTVWTLDQPLPRDTHMDFWVDLSSGERLHLWDIADLWWTPPDHWPVGEPVNVDVPDIPVREFRSWSATWRTD